MNVNNKNNDDENQEKRSPKELFAEILESLEKYTTEKAEALLIHKKKLLSTLKTHRPLKLGEYHYGLTQTLQKDHRLIVFEWKDKTMVREYTQRNDRVGLWDCRECDVKYQRGLRALRSFLYFINGIVFVPIAHDCKPRDYNLVMQYQKYLEEGNTQLARRMSITVNFEFGQNSFANVINKLENFCSLRSNLVSTQNGRTVNNATSANLKRKSNGYTLSLECVNKKTKPQSEKNRSICDDPSSNRKSDIPTVKKPETIPIPKNTFPFKIPSTFELKEICNKLEIKYSKEAIEFWKEVKFVRIDPFSKNIQTQKFKTKNLYKILSNFLTGRFSDYEQIYFAINSAFRDKLVSDGKVPVEEINELISSYTVTEKHLKFIAKYIPCRIMIFDRDNNDEVKKYGNWKTFDKSNVLTLVLSFSKRKYSVVTNL